MSKITKDYLFTTFTIMVVCWGSCVLFSLWGFSLTKLPLLYIPYMLGGLSPTIASFIVKKQNKQVRSFKEWLATVFDFKHNIFSYLLLPALAGLFFFCLCNISGYTPGAPLFALIFMIPMMLFGGGLEEAGWRGILQPELEQKYGYTIATIVVSVIWWLWHLPLFFIQGVSQYGADFFAFGISVIGLSFALSAIKRITNSTLLCILFHCIINSLHGVYLIEENIGGNCIASFALILVSYFLLWLQKKKPIFK